MSNIWYSKGLEFAGSIHESSKNILSQDEILTGNLYDFVNGVGGGSNDPKRVEGINAIHDVARVVATTKRIAKSTNDIFKENDWVAGQPMKFKSLALLVSSSIRMDFSRINELFPIAEFNPYFKLFNDEVIALDPRILGMYKLTHPLSQGEWAETVVELNNFVNEIRKGANNPDFIKLDQHHTRNSNKNQASLEFYIDKLFEYKSRLLVVRVDLKYGVESSLAGTGGISYQEADNHRKELLNDIRYRLFKDSYVGYAWKLEYGLMSSLHYHLLLFLDASKVRLDVRVGRIIGEQWRNKITAGKGAYWNCNANKNDYGRFCGLGVISHNDQTLRRNLRKAANYLIKSDYFVRSVIPSTQRTFGKGGAPAKAKSNRGRPRKE
ncbi:YagK/YfjJ domain-containing protein [Pseudomonas arsenicoxydans]|uniref:YagK/YfjJ C-terminal domain-containing protein n=1 Tax=Pseudomonas arsenicoxydans TaxID=702115 RepID=A0A4P6G0H6_9PSED|nr:inovirus-type Gp2 protein [Pseudomonas arsenicoxydans]QAY84098.1 hypothetical protein CUN61_08910 [Pseudomonas arsenicoxydans]